MLYTSAWNRYQRRKTREVLVGNVGIGAHNPIRVQSMTISDTKDTAAVVAETRQLVEAGCEIVRITAPTIHHAENLKEIKASLRREGLQVPLVADIHFTPQAAMIAADYVEKVRINPGNYADRKLFAVKEYTDREYAEELEHMAEKFLPLVRKCKQNGVALRIGTNHGSLSDRIMNRYGDTPEGMVASALEFVELCESESFRNVVFSMKASSPFTMVAAYRLLVQRLNETGRDYPIHLGVTEAGEGEDGRIKSALGIGALLEDGIGDTVRVSLTEDSVHEIPVAKRLVEPFNRRFAEQELLDTTQASKESLPWDTIHRARRASREISGIGGQQKYAVVATVDLDEAAATEDFQRSLGDAKTQDTLPDLVFLEAKDSTVALKRLTALRAEHPGLRFGLRAKDPESAAKLLDQADALRLAYRKADDATWLRLAENLSQVGKTCFLEFDAWEDARAFAEKSSDEAPWVFSLPKVENPVQAYRKLAVELQNQGRAFPLHLEIVFSSADAESKTLRSASMLGALLVDGLGDSLEVHGFSFSESRKLSFNVLQAGRLRISKAEFIACPSCGRTLFDLQETTRRIKSKTSHLKGVKIAIMGCIVNGPGEMADADFGYVGGGPGKIHLYVGKDCVEKNIPSQIADEKLIELIKKYERWVEPPLS